MKKFYFFILLIMAPTFQAFAEYRVYQYYVRSKIQNLVTTSEDLVTSTLNPITYVAYHGGRDSIEVHLLRSWQCLGHTSNKPVCTISEGKEINATGNNL